MAASRKPLSEVLFFNPVDRDFLLSWRTPGTQYVRIFSPVAKSVTARLSISSPSSKEDASLKCKAELTILGIGKKVQFCKILYIGSDLPKMNLLTRGDLRKGGEIEGLRSQMMATSGVFFQYDPELTEGEIPATYLVFKKDIERFIDTVRDNWIMLAVIDDLYNQRAWASGDVFEVFMSDFDSIKIGGYTLKMTNEKEYFRLCCFVIFKTTELLVNLHRQKRFHRDMKPENVLLYINMKALPKKARYKAEDIWLFIYVKLLDAGHIKYLPDESSTRTERIRDRRGSVNMGTSSYSPPEILFAREREETVIECDPEVIDSWGVGMTLATMLSHTYPFGTIQRKDSRGRETVRSEHFFMHIHNKFKNFVERNPTLSPAYFLHWYWSGEAHGYPFANGQASSDALFITLGEALNVEEYDEVMRFINDTLQFDPDKRLTLAQLHRKYAHWGNEHICKRAEESTTFAGCGEPKEDDCDDASAFSMSCSPRSMNDSASSDAIEEEK